LEGKPNESDLLERLCVDRSIILQWVLQE